MDKPIKQHPISLLIWDHLVLKMGIQPVVNGDVMSFPFKDEIITISVSSLPKSKQ